MRIPKNILPIIVVVAGAAAGTAEAAGRAIVWLAPVRPVPDDQWRAPVQPPPARGTVLPEPVNMGTYGTYQFRFPLQRNKTANRPADFQDWTPEQMMAQLNSNFSGYFTFTGCGKQLHVGQRCRLKTTLAPDGPVEVIAVAPSGFAIRALPGHPEGAGRTIRFQFRPDRNQTGDVTSMSLIVEAWGPVRGAALAGTLNADIVALPVWSIFQNNIRQRFPDKPPEHVTM